MLCAAQSVSTKVTRLGRRSRVPSCTRTSSAGLRGGQGAEEPGMAWTALMMDGCPARGKGGIAAASGEAIRHCVNDFDSQTGNVSNALLPKPTR